jgi:hypothetical protein
MAEAVVVCGYRKGQAKVFDLAAGGKLPVGWADKPAAGDHPHEIELAIKSPPLPAKPVKPPSAKPPREKATEAR